MRKILFIDRDGTIIVEPADEQVDSYEKLRFLPGAITALGRIQQELDYELVLVTNQDGLGTESFPEDTFWPVHNLMLQILADEGVTFKEVHIDRSFPDQNMDTRKPGTAMLQTYLDGSVDLGQSAVIGDRPSDVQLARNLGTRAIRISAESDAQADFTATDWQQIYRFLKNPPRRAQQIRKTSETEIEVKLNLDGKGEHNITTGIGFFDHMLQLLAVHSSIDMQISVKGDLHVDSHHTIEDTALVLGQALEEALGRKQGINRYGFFLPMDDCAARVALDFSGRPWCNWQAEFRREKIGEMPTEMFFHFFKSFSDAARCNLYIEASGANEHHKIEAIFKALARSLRTAVGRESGSDAIPSSKGML